MADGLLHLGAMAVLTGVVFSNLDKASNEPQNIENGMMAIRTRIRAWTLEYDAEISYREDETGTRKISRSYKSLKAHFLLCIGKVPERRDFGMMRYLYGLVNFLLHPTAFLIGDGFHTTVVGWLTLSSLLFFLCQIAHETFALPYIFEFATKPGVLFWLYTATVISALYFAWLSHRVELLNFTVDRMMAELDSEQDHDRKKFQQDLRKDAESTFANRPPPVGRE